MEEKKITVNYKVYSKSEMTESELRLIEMACKATENSYSPYSNFKVGAAIELGNGEIVCGCNQENAAFSITICAERSAIFSAGSKYPTEKILSIAIAANDGNGITEVPVSPCGACRQALVECETKSHTAIKILLCGRNKIYRIDGIENLMPLSFSTINT